VAQVNLSGVCVNSDSRNVAKFECAQHIPTTIHVHKLPVTTFVIGAYPERIRVGLAQGCERNAAGGY